ncbi:unnamed protein product, partial [marine sediment metagenome]
MKRTRPRNVEEIDEFILRPFRSVRIVMGENVIIHPTASLGGSGFTWARKDDGSI